MNSLAVIVSAIIFLIVAVLHLLRFIFKIGVRIGNYTVPLWFSIPGFVFPFLLGLWLFVSCK